MRGVDDTHTQLELCSAPYSRESERAVGKRGRTDMERRGRYVDMIAM